jgi:NAD(P)-dependent dehydrogenase (short-subunit alcohol dehydrogenase family)
MCISWRACVSGKVNTDMPGYNFTDRVALVTGGSRGLGLAFAQALARAGAVVALVARSENELRGAAQTIEQAGGHVLAFPADVTDRRAVEKVIAEVERQLGHIDLLVNSAGVFRALGPIAEVDSDEWWREIEINVRGTYLCTRTVLPGMLASQHGRIINLVSAAGLKSLPTTSAYCVSKTAVIRLTESLALENSDQGIRVFAMHPGTVRTPMSDYAVQSDEVKRRAPFVQQWFQQLYRDGADTPIERSVELMLTLASGKADTLSGRFIDIDDDLDVLLQQTELIEREDLYTLRLRTHKE